MSQWVCSECTYLNHAELRECEICESDRDLEFAKRLQEQFGKESTHPMQTNTNANDKPMLTTQISNSNTTVDSRHNKNETIASANLLAKYQTLVYGNDQLLLKQRKSFNVIPKNNIIPNPAHMHPVEPLFAKSIHENEKSKVYGYIRQQCQPLLHLYISMDIKHIVLYYYCFSEEQYDGSIDEWTKDELCGRYIPLQPLRTTPKQRRMFFEGKSTWFTPSKQLGFGDKVVIKKITDLQESSTLGTMQRILLLLRELATLRTVSHHPTIVDMYDVLPPADPNKVDSLTLIYERAETDLRHIFSTNQYFSSLHVQHILYQILCGVKYIHDAKIVHRDLHPSSILINADGRIKITSFNKACGIHERQFYQISCAQYISPEMLLLQQPYAKDLCLSDMWAVGCIFAELLQMEKVNCRNPQHRRPLFEVIWIDQLRGIFEVIGYQRDCDVDWITDQDTRKRVDRIRASFFYSHHSICDAHFDYDKSREAEASRLATRFSGTTKDGVALLNNMLKFNIRRRLRAKHAIKSTYFDKVRDSNLENMMPSRTYKYPQIKQYGREQLPKNEFNRLLSEEISNYA
eukprot:1077327_1